MISETRNNASTAANIVDELMPETSLWRLESVRIYGEMVELLAREANYSAAAQLEGLWNELMSQHPFRLLCGYSAAHFAGPDAGTALAAICCAHSHSVCKRSDPLGRFLLGSELIRQSSGSR